MDTNVKISKIVIFLTSVFLVFGCKTIEPQKPKNVVAELPQFDLIEELDHAVLEQFFAPSISQTSYIKSTQTGAVLGRHILERSVNGKILDRSVDWKLNTFQISEYTYQSNKVRKEVLKKENSVLLERDFIYSNDQIHQVVVKDYLRQEEYSLNFLRQNGRNPLITILNPSNQILGYMVLSKQHEPEIFPGNFMLQILYFDSKKIGKGSEILEFTARKELLGRFDYRLQGYGDQTIYLSKWK